MSAQPFKAKAYLKEGCPFSFKFFLFMIEAGLADRIEVIRCKPDSADFEAVTSRLAAATGKPATFPTVEIEPGRHQSDSEELIKHFAAQHGINAASLPALSFYKETIFPQLIELHKIKEQRERPS